MIRWWFKPPPPRNDSELCMKLTSLGYPNVLWESISGRLTHQKPGIPGLASTGPRQEHSTQLKQDTEGITIPAFLSNTLATLLIYCKFTQKHCPCKSTWYGEGHTWHFVSTTWMHDTVGLAITQKVTYSLVQHRSSESGLAKACCSQAGPAHAASHMEMAWNYKSTLASFSSWHALPVAPISVARRDLSPVTETMSQATMTNSIDRFQAVTSNALANE